METVILVRRANHIVERWEAFVDVRSLRRVKAGGFIKKNIIKNLGKLL